MNTQQEDGGPAFPVPNDGEWLDPETCTQWRPFFGMSIRDYFAAAAMAAFISNESRVSAMAHATDGQEGIVDFAIALSAYNMADAMIEARKEGA